MCKDMRNYFDNKVNNEKLEAEIVELKQEICKINSTLLLKDKLILVLQDNLASTEGRLNASWCKNKKKDVLISNYRRDIKKLTEQK